ncbi:MAG: NnrU family protein [Pseudomonadota bacterium]
MKRPGLLLYGVLAYIAFNLAFLYMLGFLLELPFLNAVNDGPVGSIAYAIAVNTGLVFLFGFFHSLMARARFKAWWTQIIPADAERSTFVMQSALFLGLAIWQWQPIPATIWAVDGAVAWFAYAVFLLGVALVLVSTFLIDHFELFGLRQIWSANTARAMSKPKFRVPFLYRFVRHPMQLGVILLLFATPHMTVGHLLFAGLMTLYVLIGLWFEERALVREFGAVYRAYQNQVPRLVPRMTPLSHAQIRTFATAW